MSNFLYDILLLFKCENVLKFYKIQILSMDLNSKEGQAIFFLPLPILVQHPPRGAN